MADCDLATNGAINLERHSSTPGAEHGADLLVRRTDTFRETVYLADPLQGDRMQLGDSNISMSEATELPTMAGKEPGVVLFVVFAAHKRFV